MLFVSVCNEAGPARRALQRLRLRQGPGAVGYGTRRNTAVASQGTRKSFAEEAMALATKVAIELASRLYRGRI